MQDPTPDTQMRQPLMGSSCSHGRLMINVGELLLVSGTVEGFRRPLRIGDHKNRQCDLDARLA